MDDPTFAPPPEKPPSYDTRYNRSSRAVTYTTPSYDMVKHSGTVMARISIKSLILKRWKQIFWITYGEHKVVFFRNKADFDEWLSNPYLNKEERMQLIKAGVSFKNGTQALTGIKYFRALPLKAKEYLNRGIMHTFKLEQWMHYGPVIVGAFASNSQIDAQALYMVIKHIIKTQKTGSKQLHKKNSSDNQSYTSIGYNSSYSAKSAPLSRTVLPEREMEIRNGFGAVFR